jgi:hypothetical protein
MLCIRLTLRSKLNWYAKWRSSWCSDYIFNIFQLVGRLGARPLHGLHEAEKLSRDMGIIVSIYSQDCMSFSLTAYRGQHFLQIGLIGLGNIDDIQVLAPFLSRISRIFFPL